jgi:SAM-dependent methyltransferase
VHHYSTDHRRLIALRECARVLRPGGRMLITVWAWEQVCAVFVAFCVENHLFFFVICLGFRKSLKMSHHKICLLIGTIMIEVSNNNNNNNNNNKQNRTTTTNNNRNLKLLSNTFNATIIYSKKVNWMDWRHNSTLWMLLNRITTLTIGVLFCKNETLLRHKNQPPFKNLRILFLKLLLFINLFTFIYYLRFTTFEQSHKLHQNHEKMLRAKSTPYGLKAKALQDSNRSKSTLSVSARAATNNDDDSSSSSDGELPVNFTGGVEIEGRHYHGKINRLERIFGL